MADILKYPIGQQNFKNLRDANCIYVDKTGYIEKIINSDGSAEMALRQILDKQYTHKFQTDGRKIFCIGVNFSSKTRCIENWIVGE